MIILGLIMLISGIGLFVQMIAWCIQTWKEACEEDKLSKYIKNQSFEDFSEMMRKTDLKLGE